MNEKYTVVAETVRDNKTGLTWQRRVPTKVYTWAEAKEYAKTLRLGGHTDWRLPTIKELLSIVDFSRGDPAIDLIAFPNTPSGLFWSSSPNAIYTNFAWGVDFGYGSTVVNYTSNDYRVRCVR